LRAEILQVAASRQGLDAPALRQHLLASGFAATVDRLLAPSVDTGFLLRRSDPNSVRKGLSDVIGMLMRDDLAAEATDIPTDGDLSPGSWDRFVAAKTRVLQERFGEDG
jgi:hypothetical protein